MSAWRNAECGSPYTLATESLFSVIVPVLSVASTSIDPKSSMAESRLGTTCFFASTSAPRDSEIVVTRGSASGIAETVRAIVNSRNSPGVTALSVTSACRRNTSGTVTPTIFRMNALKRETPTSNALGVSAARIMPAISPTMVRFPAS